MKEFFNTKVKALVVFLFSLASLGILLFSTVLSTAIMQEWYGIIYGIFLMLTAIPFHCLGKKIPSLYLISFLFNSIGNGLSLSALYLIKETEMHFFFMLLGALIPSVILFLVYAMLQCFHKTKKVTVTVACILNAAFTLICTVFWIADGSILFSFGFFSSLVSFFYLCVFGITINHNERFVLRDISFGSFGSFIILTVVVIAVLSEGEILDGLDAPDLDFKKRKKQA